MSARETLGQQLVREGLLTAAQVQAALSTQLQFDGRLGTNLIELGMLTEEQVTAALGRQHRVPPLSDQDVSAIAKSVLLKLSARAAATLRAVPLRMDPARPNTLRVAMADPGNLRSVDDLAVMLGCRVQPVAVADLRLGQLLEKHYGIARPARMFVRVVTDAEEELHPGDAQGYAPVAARVEASAGSAGAGAKSSAARAPGPVRRVEPKPETRLLTPPPVPLQGAERPASAARTPERHTEQRTPERHTEQRTPERHTEQRAPERAAPKLGAVRPALGDVLGKFSLAGAEPLSLLESALTPEMRSAGAAHVAPVGELEFELQEFDPGELAVRLTLAPRHSPSPVAAHRTASEGEFDWGAPAARSSGGSLTDAEPPMRGGADDFVPDQAHPDLASLGAPPPDSAEFGELEASGAQTSTPPRSSPRHSSLRHSERTAIRPERPRYTLEQILEQLSATDERDLAADAVLCYLAQAFPCALMLIVRGDVAYGWKGFAPGATREQIESIVVPLSAPSLFRQVFTSGHPFRGAPPATGERIHTRFWKMLQSEPVSEVLLTPIFVEHRLVNLIYAHPEADRRVKPVAQAHLVQLASAAGLAYRRAIRRTAVTSAAG